MALTNADNFSRYDAEDMAVMREKGTKVLWQVDYAGRAAEFADAAKLGAWLDRVVSSVAANGMDGYSFTGIPNAGDPAAVQRNPLSFPNLSHPSANQPIFDTTPFFFIRVSCLPDSATTPVEGNASHVLRQRTG